MIRKTIQLNNLKSNSLRLIKSVMSKLGRSKHYFSDKGTLAEEVFNAAASKKYFTHFTFPNIKIKDNAGEDELCDLLMVNENTAIIWQLKNIKKGSKGYSPKEIKKGIKQCYGAKRNMKRLGKMKLVNLAGQTKEVDLAAFDDVHMVTLVNGKNIDNVVPHHIDPKKGFVHVMFKESMEYLFEEMDTIEELSNYLRAKEELAAQNKVKVFADERELMAYYLLNDRSFGELTELTGGTILFNNSGSAKTYSKSKKVKERKKVDTRWSKAWDLLIEKAASATNTTVIETDKETGNAGLMKMIGHSRFERRVLGSVFMRAAVKAREEYLGKQGVFRRYFPTSKGVTYIFNFHEEQDSQQARDSNLYMAALTAAAKFRDNKIVVALATNKNLLVKGADERFDWCILDLRKADIGAILSDPQLQAAMIANKYLTAPDITELHAKEYPDS